jgi:hypothetical protein
MLFPLHLVGGKPLLYHTSFFYVFFYILLFCDKRVFFLIFDVGGRADVGKMGGWRGVKLILLTTPKRRK